MNYNLTKPCSSCPFRADIKPFLTPDRAVEITDSIFRHQQSFPCHHTMVCDGEEGLTTGPNSEHCAGAMIMLEKMGYPNQMMRISERLGAYDRTKLDMDAPVFDDVEDMVEAHEEQADCL